MGKTGNEGRRSQGVFCPFAADESVRATQQEPSEAADAYEGGADNDEVYNFALFNYASVGLTYTFNNQNESN